MTEHAFIVILLVMLVVIFFLIIYILKLQTRCTVLIRQYNQMIEVIFYKNRNKDRCNDTNSQQLSHIDSQPNDNRQGSD